MQRAQGWRSITATGNLIGGVIGVEAVFAPARLSISRQLPRAARGARRAPHAPRTRGEESSEDRMKRRHGRASMDRPTDHSFGEAVATKEHDMPVTPQGIAAEQQLFADVDAIKPSVVERIAAAQPIAPTELARLLGETGTRDEITREAVWQLLDENRILLDDELRLVPAEQ